MFACSGPGAPYAIGESIRIGQIHAAVLALLLLVSATLSLRYGRRTIPIILLAMLALHPAWTISAISGDCGHFKRDASWAFTGGACLALMWQVAFALDARSDGPPTAP